MRPPRRSRDTTGGFLLTETLATFAISAVVLVGLVSASSVLLRSVDRSVAHAQDMDDLDRSLAAIKRDLSGLTRARFDGIEPQPFVFRGGPNTLYFARRDRDAAGLLETRVVAIREIVDGASKRLTRAEARLRATAVSFADLRYAPPRELATGHARLRFSYLGRQPPRGAEAAVLTNWTNAKALPVAVLIDAVDTATSRVIVSIRVPIRANGDIGCIATTPVPPPLAAPPAPGAAGLPAPTPAAPLSLAPDNEFCAVTNATGDRP